MGGHLPQLGQDTLYVFISINEGDDDRQFAARLDKMRRVHAASPLKTCDCVKGDRPSNVLLTQILQNFDVQRTVVPRITFR